MDCPDLYNTAPWKAQKVAALAAAATPWPILLTGPRGSGKSLLARFIHRHSPRAAAEFVEAPAPTLSEGLLQGELRGHVRGAFTDARVDHGGCWSGPTAARSSSTRSRPPVRRSRPCW